MSEPERMTTKFADGTFAKPPPVATQCPGPSLPGITRRWCGAEVKSWQRGNQTYYAGLCIACIDRERNANEAQREKNRQPQERSPRRRIPE